MPRRPLQPLTPARHRLARLGNFLTALAAGVWLGTILAFGLTAASTFHTLRDLQPSLTADDRPASAPDFSTTPFDTGQPDYLAGRVVNGVTTSVLMPVSIGCLVALTLGLIIRQLAITRVAWFSNWLGFLAFACFVLTFCAQSWMALLHEAMYEPVATLEMRDEFRSDFDSLHKTSERLFGFIALTQLALLGLTTLTPLPPLERKDQTNDPPSDA